MFRFSTVTALALALAAGMAQAETWVIKTSPYDITQTADKFEAIIQDSPATLITHIDHQAATQKVEIDMTPATVLIYGNPAMGTPIMQAQPRAAIDLPLRVLIWDEGGATRIGHLAPDALAQ